jgi:hypothetical protein
LSAQPIAMAIDNTISARATLTVTVTTVSGKWGTSRIPRETISSGITVASQAAPRSAVSVRLSR